MVIVPATNSKTRVLLIEDNWQISAVLMALLRGSGCEVSRTGSGEEAVPLLNTWTPQIVLVSHCLPTGASGPEVVRFLRKLLPASTVFIGAGYTEKNAEDFRQVGISATVDKPFKVKELLETMRTARPIPVRRLEKVAGHVGALLSRLG